MNEALLRLYHGLPAPLRGFAASVHGARLRRRRYGADTESLVAAARERESWSADRWRSYSEARLATALDHAARRVPYYRAAWQERRRRGDRSSWQVLAHWPVLRKAEVRAHAEALVADDAGPRFPEHTSGTTGTPLQVWWDHEAIRQWYALFEARIRGWHGLSRHDRWAMLGGQLVVPPERRRPPYWVWNAPMRQLYMSSYHLAPSTIEACVGALARHQVRYLLGYASSLTSLATLAIEAGIETPRLECAISNGEPLYDDQRAVIQQAFGGPVIDTFGMAELVCAASECRYGTLHLWPEVGWPEILDADDQPCPTGTSGRLIATGLLNRAMPLIRYDTENRAVLATDSSCECGRELPALARVEGRNDDLVVTPDGRRIGRLDPVFKTDLPILEAQIVQDAVDHVRIRAVPARDFTVRDGERLQARARARLGPSMRVSLDITPQIPRGRGGKFRAVVRRPDALTTADSHRPPPLDDPRQAPASADLAQPRVLMVTCEWPDATHPHRVPFLVRQVRSLRRAGVHLDVFVFRGGGRPDNYLDAWWQLRPRIDRRRYDVVHAQWGQSALPTLPCRLPLVVTFRGSDLEGLPDIDGRETWRGRLLRALSKRMAYRADTVVTVSERLARMLPGLDATVLPSGLDLTRFQSIEHQTARRQLGLDPDTRLVLFAAARDNPIKRYPLARAAVDVAAETLGPDQPTELVVTETVPPEEMPIYMSACDALLMTSRHEGSPNVVKEALACGLPVVSVDIGDVAERLSGIEGCRICDATAAALGSGLVEILRTPKRIDARDALSALDENHLAHKQLEIYRRLMRAETAR
ncbi:MAG: glycosyltransferase [Acidobacteriota bacterium]